MMAKKYRSRLISIYNPFDEIYTLEFEPLSGKFRYHPGQFLHLALDSDYDGSAQWPESRCFSMRSNPLEETIRITYAVKGKFTSNMRVLNVGSEMWLKLPYGNLFSQPHNKKNTVFIAGGTGITPFLSLFTHESFSKYSMSKIYLGFRSELHNIYKEELNQLKTPQIKIFYENINGLIDINLIFSENGIMSDYFISGPPAMIKIFKQSLILKGIPSTQILTDEWE